MGEWPAYWISDGTAKNVHFVKFEDLTRDPQIEMNKIYDYLGIESWQHNFDDVKQVTKEDDTIYGIYGDHQIRTKVEPIANDFHKVLGTPASNWIKDTYKWFFDEFKYY